MRKHDCYFEKHQNPWSLGWDADTLTTGLTLSNIYFWLNTKWLMASTLFNKSYDIIHVLSGFLKIYSLLLVASKMATKKHFLWSIHLNNAFQIPEEVCHIRAIVVNKTEKKMFCFKWCGSILKCSLLKTLFLRLMQVWCITIYNGLYGQGIN